MGGIFTVDANRMSNSAATVQLFLRGAGGVWTWTHFTAPSISDYDKRGNQQHSAAVTRDSPSGDWPRVVFRVTGLDKGKKYRFSVLGTTKSGCQYGSTEGDTISAW